MVLNYSLSQMVQGVNDKNNFLQNRYPQDIEVMEETLMTYRIATKSHHCPLKVKIIYNDKKQRGVTRGDLKVFYSLTTKEPTENNCIRSLLNVR